MQKTFVLRYLIGVILELFVYLFICDSKLLCGGLSYFIFYLILFLLREGGKQGKKRKREKRKSFIR